MKIINRSTCNKLYDDAVTPRMLCAGNLQGGVDACQVSVYGFYGKHCTGFLRNFKTFFLVLTRNGLRYFLGVFPRNLI